MNKNQKDLRLLPNYFKKIAWGLLTLSVIIIVLSISKVLLINKELINNIFESGILLSLLLMALTNDKIEDELTMKIRVGAFAGSFISGVAFFIAYPFVNLIFDGSFMSDVGAFQLLLTMLFFYFGFFSLAKRKR